jgi:hypothetical protein
MPFDAAAHGPADDQSHRRGHRPAADGQPGRQLMHHQAPASGSPARGQDGPEFGRPAHPVGVGQHQSTNSTWTRALARQHETALDGPDQADSSPRPLRRRAERIARPARVRIRRRKPCVLARRRLFGWKVRLLTGTAPSLSGGHGWLFDERIWAQHETSACADATTVRMGGPQGQTAPGRSDRYRDRYCDRYRRRHPDGYRGRYRDRTSSRGSREGEPLNIGPIAPNRRRHAGDACG